MNFLNKVVLITGAASGIGEKTALHFAKLSARLSLIDVKERNLKTITEKCEKVSKTKVLKIVADLSKDEDVKNAVEKTFKHYGRIDVVVNCAGTFGAGSITDGRLMESLDRALHVDLRGAAAVTHYSANHLIETKGCIINISSAAAVSTMTNIPHAVAKAALNHFTRCVALELAHKGVRVNAILPGVVKTNLLLHAGVCEEENEVFMKKSEASAPIKGLVKAEDVAEMVTFLASDKARSITGTCYVIDNGVVLRGLKEVGENLIRAGQ